MPKSFWIMIGFRLLKIPPPPQLVAPRGYGCNYPPSFFLKMVCIFFVEMNLRDLGGGRSNSLRRINPLFVFSMENFVSFHLVFSNHDDTFVFFR